MQKKNPENKKAETKGQGGMRMEKSKLHPRSKHKDRYNFSLLIKDCPDLAAFVTRNVYQDETINFADPKAVKTLNKALLKHFYNVESWEIPDDYLCPPIPGRADYIHHMADLMCSSNYGKLPVGEKIRCLDVGVGANCIYPLIGYREYGWSFIGSDIDPIAIESARKIIASNPDFKGKVKLILQKEPRDYFYGIILKDEPIDLSICNPPFHASQAEAQSGTQRKLKNLNRTAPAEIIKNFGGQNHELWCEGGEKRFVSKMIRESRKFARSCYWFSSIISRQSNLKSIYEALKKVNAVDIKTISMGQGNKTSRIVAWTFLSPIEQKKWKETRWQQST